MADRDGLGDLPLFDSRCIFLSLRRYDHLTDLNWQLTLYGISFFFSTQVYAIMDRY